jgi:hypothetical protein
VMRKQTLRILQNHEQTATSLNTDQLFAGELADGSIMPDYSPVSVSVFGKRPGPWQGYDKGDMYKETYMDAKQFPVLFGSKSETAPLFAAALENKGYKSEEIFGLNKPNLKEIAIEYTLPDLQRYVRGLIRLR